MSFNYYEIDYGRIYDHRDIKAEPERVNMYHLKNGIKKLATAPDNKCDLVPQAGVASHPLSYILPQRSQFPLKFDMYPLLPSVPYSTLPLISLKKKKYHPP